MALNATTTKTTTTKFFFDDSENKDATFTKDIFNSQMWSLYYGVFFTEATTGILLNLAVILIYKLRAVKATTFNYLIAHLSASQIVQLLGATLSIMIDVRKFVVDKDADVSNNNNSGTTNNDFNSINKNNESIGALGASNIVAYISCGVGPGKSLSLAFTATKMGILCIMSITQHMAITRPLDPMNLDTIKRIAKMQWGVGLVCVSPNLIRMLPNRDGYNYCELNTVFSSLFNRMYLIGAALVFYIVPWAVLLVSFTSVVYNFYFKLAVGQSRIAMRKYRERVVWLMGVWVLIYAACWSSYAVFMVLMALNYYGHTPRGEIMKHRLNCLTSLPCYAASTLNVCYYFYSVKVGAVVKRRFRTGKDEKKQPI